MKKVLSLVLVIAMVLSSMSFAFGASKFEDVADDSNYLEAIDTLSALGVIKGFEDGSFRPESTLTRAQMAVLMVELLGYGDLVSNTQKSNFSDTQGHWADAWIALASGRGLMIGTGDGKFNPEGQLTYDMVLTTLVRGLGYTDTSNELKDMPWPTNFKVKAAELNITKGVDMTAGAADRGGVAQAMYNALEQQLVKVNSDGDIVREYISEGKNDKIPVLLISRIANPNYDFVVGFQHIDSADKNYAGDKVDLTPYLFQSVEAYFNKNNSKEVVYVGDVNSLTYTESFEDTFVLPGTSTKGELEVGDYTFTIKGSQVSYNNVEEKLDDLKLADLEDATITVVLQEDETRVKDDAEVAGIIVSKATAFVQIEEEYKDGETEIDEIYLPVKSKKVDTKNLIIKGDAEELKDIEKDDIVSVYAPLGDDATVEATDRLTLVVTRDTVDGKITGLAKDAYYIDRTKYEINDALNMDVLEIGDAGTFFLDDNGKVIAYKGESEGSNEYAVVEDIFKGSYETSTSGKKIVDKAPRVKLNNASDETVTYDFDVTLDNGVIENKNLKEIFDVNADESITLKTDKDFSGKLVSYTLDSKSKEVTNIEVVGRKIENVKTNSKSFVLASNAVIFDKEGNVISESKLGSEIKLGYAVYKNAKIVALLVDDVMTKETYGFAYINSVYGDTDSDGTKVQRVNAYIDGAKKDIYTAKKSTVTSFTEKGLYILGLDDDGIVQSDKGQVAIAKTSATTASGINASTGKLVVGGKTVYFDQNAGTIIRIKTNGDIETVSKISAIKNDETKIQAFAVKADGTNEVLADGSTINFIIIWE